MEVVKKKGEGVLGLDIFISIKEQLMLGMDMHPIMDELKTIKKRNEAAGHPNKSKAHAMTRIDETTFVMAAKFIERFVMVMDAEKARTELYGPLQTDSE